MSQVEQPEDSGRSDAQLGASSPSKGIGSKATLDKYQIVKHGDRAMADIQTASLPSPPSQEEGGLPILEASASSSNLSSTTAAVASALFGSQTGEKQHISAARSAANAAKYRAALEAATMASMPSPSTPPANTDVSTEWHVHLVKQVQRRARDS